MFQNCFKGALVQWTTSYKISKRSHSIALSYCEVSTGVEVEVLLQSKYFEEAEFARLEGSKLFFPKCLRQGTCRPTNTKCFFLFILKEITEILS